MAKKYRITDAEAAKVLIKNVNDRPNALATYGEAKMSPTQVKDLFDRQFLLVKEKHEALADVVEETEESIEEMNDKISGLEEKVEELEVGDIQEKDPTVPDWAKQPDKPAYTAEEVGAAEYYWVLETFSGIQLEVNGNGKKINAVSDEMNRQYVILQMALSELAERLNAVANSSDVDLDQLAEIVAYIKSNKSLIDAITTSKVSVLDIVDNLLTNVSNKPLSARMGLELKRMIDKIQVPDSPVTSVNGQTGDVILGAGDVGAMPAGTKIPAKTSDIANNSGFITKAVSDLANYYTKSQTFTRDEINAKISAIPKFAIEVVSSLPTSNISATTVYLVGGGSGNDLYTEYIYANGKWEILGAQTVDLTGYATETWVNTQLGAYLKQSELEAAINTALATAKASGEFDGADGERGTGILNTTTGIDSYTTTVNGIKPTYRIALTTLKAQSKVSDVIVGDTVRYSYFLYPIIYVDADYAYMGTRVSIRGGSGADGKTPVKGTDYFTSADKTEMVNAVIAALPKYAGGVS